MTSQLRAVEDIEEFGHSFVGLVYEQQKGESNKAYGAFTIYRDMASEDRSYAAAARLECGEEASRQKVASRTRSFQRFGKEQYWQFRAASFDRNKLEKELSERLEQIGTMNKQHSQMAKASIQSLFLPIQALLKQVQENGGVDGTFRKPVFNKDGTPRINPNTGQQAMELVLPIDKYIALVDRCSRAIAAMTSVERLARGESTAQISSEIPSDDHLRKFLSGTGSKVEETSYTAIVGDDPILEELFSYEQRQSGIEPDEKVSADGNDESRRGNRSEAEGDSAEEAT
jgi:hypothetical protein